MGRKQWFVLITGIISKLCLALDGPGTCFKKFTKYIAQASGIRDFDVYIYDCMPYQSNNPTMKERQRYAKKDKFFSAMRRLGFIIRLGKLQKLGKTDFKQKKVDTLWTADVSRLVYTKKVDKVVLISGDSDFVPGIQIAKDAGVRTILWCGRSENTSTSYDLQKLCNEVHRITKDVLKQCRMDTS